MSGTSVLVIYILEQMTVSSSRERCDSGHTSCQTDHATPERGRTMAFGEGRQMDLPTDMLNETSSSAFLQ